MYYAIFKGRERGVFTTWKRCRELVTGYSGAIYKKFSNKIEAQKFALYGPDYPKKSISDEEHIRVYTDGACSNNGKTGAVAGIGIYFGENDERNVSHKIIGKQTNNRAELLAVLEVAKILGISPEKKILIYTDSSYVIKCCSSYGEKCATKNWEVEIPNKRLVIRAYKTFYNNSQYTFKYIKAHTSNTDQDSIGNQNADRLAREACIL